MVRTAVRLRGASVAIAVLDLSALGTNVTPEQWDESLVFDLGQQLDLEDELERFWDAHARLGPLPRFMAALEEHPGESAPRFERSGR
jgi:hypothetical protein